MLKYAKKYDLSLKRKRALRIAVVAKVYADSHTLFLQTIFLLNHKSLQGIIKQPLHLVFSIFFFFFQNWKKYILSNQGGKTE